MGGHFSSGRGFRVPTSEFGFNSQKSESVRVSPTFEKRKRAARRPWRSPPFGGCPRPAGLETGDPKSVKSEWVRVSPTFEMQKTGRYPRMTRRKLMVPKAVLLRRCQAGRRLPLTRIFHSEVGQNHANPCSAGFQACRSAGFQTCGPWPCQNGFARGCPQVFMGPSPSPAKTNLQHPR